ncbi:hypothetical protein [Flavobacterium reichenbachii]|uniref:Uncharacterized protein n=1 Tax=Flavobacterium reichenbachii TaxID=362418 RepID=A0A085ZNU3_9FLAO|nr:hypothetical protein [Flavobacterium reichenbachii]KFF06107.1 hypothetical protein IW19_11460 [Flavobacterium reichenbachii]OXB14669.1 hypothetical protein B0A68_11485 [Flavobacterium reichenbachii]
MKKIVFRFWIINFLISIALFFIYRIVIAATKTFDGNFFEELIQILELLLNIGFALIYLIAMVISSFAILLNLIEKIRNNFYWSLLAFVGIPSFWVIFIIIKALIDALADNLSILTTLAIFSILYLFLTTIQFLLFRKKINKTLDIETKIEVTN